MCVIHNKFAYLTYHCYGHMIRKWRNQKQLPTQKTEVGKLNKQSSTSIKKTYRKPSEQLFPSRLPLD